MPQKKGAFSSHQWLQQSASSLTRTYPLGSWADLPSTTTIPRLPICTTHTKLKLEYHSAIHPLQLFVQTIFNHKPQNSLSNGLPFFVLTPSYLVYITSLFFIFSKNIYSIYSTLLCCSSFSMLPYTCYNNWYQKCAAFRFYLHWISQPHLRTEISTTKNKIQTNTSRWDIYLRTPNRPKKTCWSL